MKRVSLVEIIAAYLVDRADQYVTCSPCWVALTNAAEAIINGEAEAAWASGELEEALLERVREWKKAER